MYDAWFTLGCNEVINQARAYGYSHTASCAIQWLKCDGCDGLAEALGHEAYNIDTISDAPWYDDDNPATARFYGAYPIQITGMDDSTRQGSITEGIRDGGVIGGHRHGVRTVRVRALILAQGLDALEAGRSWLDAVLEPDDCSMHGSSCGQADVQFFAACPPERGTVTDYTPWALVRTNVFDDPRATSINTSYWPTTIGFTRSTVVEGAVTRIRSTRTQPGGTIWFSAVIGTDYTANTVFHVQFLARGSVPGTVYTVSMRPAVGTATGNVTLGTFTLPATPNTEILVDLTGTTLANTPTATGGFIITESGTANGSTLDLTDILVEAFTTGPFFYGGTASTQTEQYAWLGTTNGSSSTMEVRQVTERPQDEGEYRDAVEGLVRTLHGVVAISGPTVQEELQRGDAFGQIVEFILAAETPFIFGPQRELDLLPSTPVAVQDDPVNLAKYPSAELQDVALVTAATNYTLNPSLELAAAVPAWTGAVSAVSGSAPAAYFTAVRGTTSSSPPFLTSVGVASFRGRILGNLSTAASGVAEIRLVNTTSLVGLPVNTRVSVNMWVAAQRITGTAQIISVTVIVEWLDAANAIVSTTTVDTGTNVSDFDGKAYSASGLLVPATVTQARVVAVVRTNWASSATAGSNSDIRVYADANSVTVP